MILLLVGVYVIYTTYQYIEYRQSPGCGWDDRGAHGAFVTGTPCTTAQLLVDAKDYYSGKRANYYLDLVDVNGNDYDARFSSDHSLWDRVQIKDWVSGSVWRGSVMSVSADGLTVVTDASPEHDVRQGIFVLSVILLVLVLAILIMLPFAK